MRKTYEQLNKRNKIKSIYRKGINIYRKRNRHLQKKESIYVEKGMNIYRKLQTFIEKRNEHVQKKERTYFEKGKTQKMTRTFIEKAKDIHRKKQPTESGCPLISQSKAVFTYTSQSS